MILWVAGLGDARGSSTSRPRYGGAGRAVDAGQPPSCPRPSKSATLSAGSARPVAPGAAPTLLAEPALLSKSPVTRSQAHVRRLPEECPASPSIARPSGRQKGRREGISRAVWSGLAVSNLAPALCLTSVLGGNHANRAATAAGLAPGVAPSACRGGVRRGAAGARSPSSGKLASSRPLAPQGPRQGAQASLHGSATSREVGVRAARAPQ
jgi:hypothetical protein